MIQKQGFKETEIGIIPVNWYPADEDHDECIEALFQKLIGGA